MRAWLDAGAPIAIDRRSRPIGALVRLLHSSKVPVKTTATVVAQVWRDGRKQANLARMLAGVDIIDLSTAAAKRCGELLARANTA